jgi:hypothetical protein
MNNTHAAGTYLLIREEYSEPVVEPIAERSDLKVTIDRLLVLSSITIIGVFLASVLHPNHFIGCQREMLIASPLSSYSSIWSAFLKASLLCR